MSTQTQLQTQTAANSEGQTIHIRRKPELLNDYEKDTDAIVNGLQTVSLETYKKLKYPQWAPTWDRKDQGAFHHLKPFKHIDRGLFGDSEFKNLLADKSVKTKPISPKLGTEIEGIQLSKLTDKQKDDLALLAAERGVVVFRGQDFKDLPFDDITSWGKYFGPLHVHPTTGTPAGQPYFHIIIRRAKADEQQTHLAERLNTVGWHSDVTYEPQSPGITLLTMLQTSVGGDTQFIDLITAYERLSPQFQKLIENLKVVHSSVCQADRSRANDGVQRKTDIESIHPLVRYHPVLKKKYLFLNKGFATRILGFKHEESEFLLNFLKNHIETLLDAHIRANWDEQTVVVWDNRRVVHTATHDWDNDNLRHGFRLTTLD
ncbi:unnamed protein product [Ambrosiozyma monospora]|uniref:Unnamed protein product n=1 Tax=Ambrosiozyma monospora TaxID=43982 RepID=A0ACB5TGX0_AMBMO|nr:unnamed protein product [Ambrosiozyma monospora]